MRARADSVGVVCYNSRVRRIPMNPPVGLTPQDGPALFAPVSTMQFLYDLPATRRQTQAKHSQRFVRATVARPGPHTRVRPVRLNALLCSADDAPRMTCLARDCLLSLAAPPFSPLPPPHYNSYLPHPVGPSYNGYYPGLWSRRSWFDSKWAYPTSPRRPLPPSARPGRTVLPGRPRRAPARRSAPASGAPDGSQLRRPVQASPPTEPGPESSRPPRPPHSHPHPV